MEPLIRGISDTARWVAIFRAEESERPDAVFRDRLARRLAGERGKQIADAIEFSRRNSWSFVARTFLFDEFVTQHVRDGFDTVVNLAAGLDTRPYRMALSATLRWIEIDLPEIVADKAALLSDEQPGCRLQQISLDLKDVDQRRRVFNAIGESSNRVLIVAEGLIAYLDETAVGSLAQDLSRHASFKRWVFDLMSPGLLQMSRQQMGSLLGDANAPLRFAPEEGEEFVRPYHWVAVECRSLLQTAATLNRLSDEMLEFAAIPEPEGPKGEFPWAGVCLFENVNDSAA